MFTHVAPIFFAHIFLVDTFWLLSQAKNYRPFWSAISLVLVVSMYQSCEPLLHHHHLQAYTFVHGAVYYFNSIL